MTITIIIFGSLMFLTGQYLIAQVLRPGYDEQKVSVTNNNTTLHGTLAVPLAASRYPIPAVLFIAGSGPTDRDGNNKFGLHTNAYQMFCRQLSEKGIATLRYDKWGVGESAPKAKEIPAARRIFEAEVQDAIAWANFIRTDKRFSELIIVGHSQGSLVAILTAQQTQPFTTKIVSIAGLGFPGHETIKQQLAAQSSMLLESATPVIDSLVAGHTVTHIPPLLTSLFNPTLQPYLISWFRYNPVQELAKLSLPTLIVQGTNDIQVKVEDAKRLASAHSRTSLFLVEGMNHVLKIVNGDAAANYASYSKPELPIVSEIIDKVLQFIR